MDSRLHRLQWGCIFLLSFLVVSCSLKYTPKQPVRKREFSQEASRLQKIAREHPQRVVRAKSHLDLAFLYVNHRNPKLDYTRALQELQSYLALSPVKEQPEDIRNWLAILQEFEKLQTHLEGIRDANKRLHDEVAGLKEMNREMNATIERLTNLDRQIEERRWRTK